MFIALDSNQDPQKLRIGAESKSDAYDIGALFEPLTRKQIQFEIEGDQAADQVELVVPLIPKARLLSSGTP